jgi:hypothetical protein
VEPAIFGTLLERALDPTERHALGAHYTPRAYVDRLVMPTVIDPLRAEWSNAQAAALLLANEANALDGKKRDDKLAEARTEARKFHHRLCTVRVLDPACGSGNFLYVTLEHLKRLEGEVLNLLGTLGDSQEKLGLEGETVTLQQLRGIELNTRAAALAELVLWIGYLQWQARTVGVRNIAEPVVHDYGNIENRDAVLAYDDIEPQMDDSGKVVTRWDGVTHKVHPVTGSRVPDESAQTVQWRYINPRKAEWPQVDFIVGNPPFIGNKRMRDALGDGYADALRAAWPDVPESADFVMYWWHKAAETVRTGHAERFGLITTNSLTMIFNRRVIEAHQSASTPLSLVFAIPDHPWVDSANGAAVRIAMTAARAGQHEGRLLTVKSETSQDDGEVAVTLQGQTGLVHADLKIGAKVTAAQQLRANGGISTNGFMLAGSGFTVPIEELGKLEKGAPIKTYRNGKDLMSTPRHVSLIDFYGVSLDEARAKWPATYQWILERVKPERDQNNRPRLREQWWLFGEVRKTLRAALHGLPRYIATVETAKHRVFQFLTSNIAPDHMLIAIGSSEAVWLGVLSSQVHVQWALSTGGRLGVGNDPRYNKSKCFETFPFPSEDTGLTPELKARIRTLAEQIDAHRKQQQAAHPELTLTGLYNVLEKLRGGLALSAKDKTIHEQGLVAVLRTLHDELDTAVLQAYGWSDLGPVPWTDEAARAAWTDTLLQRLVNLNTRRFEEEASGTIRWLRPEFQNSAAAQPDAEQTTMDLEPDEAPDSTSPAGNTAKPLEQKPWPATLPEQIKAVADILSATSTPLGMDSIAAHFKARGRWRDRLPTILDTLVAIGRAQARSDGRWIHSAY